MTVYLLHGFRWPRRLVRIHIIINDLGEATPEWVMAPTTAEALIGDFHAKFPAIMEALPELLLIEQYDPVDTHRLSADFCYVADTVYRAELSMDLDDYNLHVSSSKEKAIKDLRAGLFAFDPAKTNPETAKVGWYLVYCGDEARGWEAIVSDAASGDRMMTGLEASAASSRINGHVESEVKADMAARPSSSLAGKSNEALESSKTSSQSRDPGALRQGIKKLLGKSDRGNSYR